MKKGEDGSTINEADVVRFSTKDNYKASILLTSASVVRSHRIPHTDIAARKNNNA